MTVFLAISNQITRIGIKSILGTCDNTIDFIECSNSFDLLNALTTENSNLLFIDLIDTGNFDWDEIQKIKDRYPTLKMIILAENYSKERLLQLKEIDVQSLLYIDSDNLDILSSFTAALEGKKHYSSKILDALLSIDSIEHQTINNQNSKISYLTDREIEIVKFIALGYTNKEIATQLFLSHHTIGVHRKNIYHKLDLHSAKEILSYALHNNLIHSNEL